MDIGLVLQNDPPASHVVEVTRQAEDAGFTHVWTSNRACCGKTS